MKDYGILREITRKPWSIDVHYHSQHGKKIYENPSISINDLSSHEIVYYIECLFEEVQNLEKQVKIETDKLSKIKQYIKES